MSQSSKRETRGGNPSTPTPSITATATATPTTQQVLQQEHEVWSYFTRDTSGKVAKCLKCDLSVKVDGEATIGLAVHLRNAHKILLKRGMEEEVEEVTPVSKQAQNSNSNGSSSSGGVRNLFRDGSANSTPTKLSRLDEKNALVGLNNRLAVILDKNRQLELENGRLESELTNAEETLFVTTNKLKTTFEKENSDVRKKLEDSDKERVRLDLAWRNLQKDYDELAKRLKSRDQDLQGFQKQQKDLEQKLSTAIGDLKKAQDSHQKISTEKTELADENAVLKSNQEDLRQQIQLETMAKLSLESKLRDQCQEIQLHKQTFEQQVSLLSVKKKSELKAVGEQLQKEYQTKLEEAIKALRGDCTSQIAANKEDQENLYNMKEENLKRQLEKANAALQGKIEELEVTKTKLVDYQKKIQLLDTEKYNLQQNLKDVQTKWKEDADKADREKKSLEADLKNMQDDKEQLINEYQDLMEVKVALDNEIAVYRRLLEGEEERLHIVTPESTPSSSPAKILKQKQKQVVVRAN